MGGNSQKKVVSPTNFLCFLKKSDDIPDTYIETDAAGSPAQFLFHFGRDRVRARLPTASAAVTEKRDDCGRPPPLQRGLPLFERDGAVVEGY